MDKHNIGLRAQDFHESLRDTVPSGPKDAYFKNTLLIGKAAALAMHVKGLSFIENIHNLGYAAAELGITGIELDAVLRQLEIVDFVRVVRSGEVVKRVDIRVPEFRSGYEDLGELWLQKGPSEIEVAGVTILNDLLEQPKTEEDLIGLGLDTDALQIVKDIMEVGQLLRSETVHDRSVVYSPLAVDANPAAYLEWVYRHPDKIALLLKELVSHQGLPVTMISEESRMVLQDALLTGVLMPVRLTGATGEKEFVFAPRGGLKPEERVILDKARAILACVRYGQNFASGRQILYPRAILQHLRTYKKFRHGHPDLFTQYSLLVEKLVGTPVHEGSASWNFHIIDTPENIQALDVAIDMLEMGEAPTARVNGEAQKALLSPHRYLGPGSTRPRLALEIHGSPQMQADIVNKMMKLVRGIGDV